MITYSPTYDLLLLQLYKESSHSCGSGAAARTVSMTDGANSRAEKAATRLAAVRVFQASGNVQMAASFAGVTARTVHEWVQRLSARGSLVDAPRSGRPQRLSHAAVAELTKIVQEDVHGSVRAAAAQLAASSSCPGAAASPSTVWRALLAANHIFRLVRRVPRLSPLQMEARVCFATANSTRDWERVMFTDSKYFADRGTGGRRGRWQLSSAPPPTAGRSRVGPCLHVYMGATAYGVTELIVVTGGSTQNRKWLNKKGGLYKGVSAAEYRHEVLPKLMDAGQRLFAKGRKRGWVLQQDGARPHVPELCREYARGRAPGGLLEPWPANSPDLSWIENIWAWMAAQLQLKPQCHSKDDLLSTLNDIRSSISVEMLQPYVHSMPHRLQQCIEMSGAAVR